jgi:hypothetical protein
MQVGDGYTAGSCPTSGTVSVSLYLLCKQGVGGSSPPSSTCENESDRIIKVAIDTSRQSLTAGSGSGACREAGPGVAACRWGNV